MECLPDDSPGRRIIHRARRDRAGFLSEEDVLAIANDASTRLTMLLVRCDCGRFLAPAQDVPVLCEAIEASGRAHVRDVSIPARRYEVPTVTTVTVEE